MEELRRDGNDTVKLGDTVRVAGAELTAMGVKVKDRGWTQGKVLRFVRHGRFVLVEVTVPGRAATRTVDADRVTRMRAKKGSR